MNNDLTRYTAQEVARTSKAVIKQKQAIKEEVQVAAIKTDGALALAGHIMQGVVKLDEHRRSLGSGDAVTDMTMAAIQQNAIRKVMNIQNDLFDPWGL